MAGRSEAANLTDQGELDGEFLAQIGGRIRELRAAKALTVQQLADRAQISRRLMTQIEHGQANPSLVTVTRIARQLDTEFTELLDTSETWRPITSQRAADHLLVWTSELGSTSHLLQASESRSADLWLWRLEPGDSYTGHADPARSQELFYVLAGELTISADDTEVRVGKGGSARLHSDRPYSYLNRGTSTARFVRTVALAP